MPPVRPLPLAFLLAVPAFLTLGSGACTSDNGDPHAVVNPDPLGSGIRIRDIANPTLPGHPKPAGTPPAVNDPVSITGATILWNDTFDETGDGKSRGTVYAQDIGLQNPPIPYSGIGIFSPSFVPADLRIAPGDVLDFNGPYSEVTSIGTAHFPAPQVLAQLSKPIGTFRYEYKVPEAAPIPLADLNDYNKGRQWLGMLVIVTNVLVGGAGVDSTTMRRVTYPILPAADAGPPTNGVAISNENYDLKTTDFPAGTVFKSVTGIVTWFYSYHIAPRYPQDLVLMGQ